MVAFLYALRRPSCLRVLHFRSSSISATSSDRHFLADHPTAAATTTRDVIDHFASLISAADHPSHLAQIHAALLSSGLHHSPVLATKFLLSAAECHHLPHARQFFEEIPHSNKNIFLFNAIIRLHSQHNAFAEAVRFYGQMLVTGIRPDCFTFPPVLKACGGLPSPAAGHAVHVQIFRFGFEDDVFVQNGLIAMYAKCGNVDTARTVFDQISCRNLVSWTSMLSGCAQNGFPLEALELFRRMRAESYDRPDFVILVSVLKAYMDVEDLEHGSSVHGMVVKGGFDNEMDLIITLTAMYAKCGHVLVARSLFDRVMSRDVILWNAMISGYAKNGDASEALLLFRELIYREIRPDSITIRSATLACAQVGSLETAHWMAEYINNSEFKDDIFINTALIDMYAKCGSIADAHAVFKRIKHKDVVVWSAIILGYGLHGRGREAVSIFNEMNLAGVTPNDVTFIGLLSACNHAGLVEEGWKYFHCMRDYHIEPRQQHYACVVDLLARAGYVEKAYQFVKSMPIEPALTVWGALLNACKIYGHVSLGEYAAEQVFALEPSNAGHYVQLSNIYASAGMWRDVGKVRVLMKQRGAAKATGCSLVEMNGKLHSFYAGDKSHPRSKEIYAMLDELNRKLKEPCFVPYLWSDLHDMNMEEMEDGRFFV